MPQNDGPSTGGFISLALFTGALAWSAFSKNSPFSFRDSDETKRKKKLAEVRTKKAKLQRQAALLRARTAALDEIRRKTRDRQQQERAAISRFLMKRVCRSFASHTLHFVLPFAGTALAGTLEAANFADIAQSTADFTDIMSSLGDLTDTIDSISNLDGIGGLHDTYTSLSDMGTIDTSQFDMSQLSTWSGNADQTLTVLTEQNNGLEACAQQYPDVFANTSNPGLFHHGLQFGDTGTSRFDVPYVDSYGNDITCSAGNTLTLVKDSSITVPLTETKSKFW